jgi:hypothetical protein
MKTQEDEAWEEMERRQGAGGFPAKRAMAADKLHWSDCAVHNGPAYPAGECDCGVAPKSESETLKLALEALEEYADQEGKTRAADEAITAIKKALAQPAQELVAKAWNDGYKAGVADERTSEANIGIAGFGAKIKPARQNPYGVAQPAQEPVAFECFKDWMVEEMPPMTTIGNPEWWAKRIYERFIHTTPPKRPWVGLTDDELADLWYKESLDWMEFARAHEAAWKEKNNG